MSEEIFDLVDDRDRIIGRQSRSEVHRLGLKHRAVHVLVFNQRGELFLQKRSFKKDTFPGAWDSSASGHLNSGETYDRCAVRELREEIGLFVHRCPKRQFKIHACEQTGQEFVWVYRCESDGPFRLNQEELECGAFFKPDHLNRWLSERPRDFADAFRLVWKYFLNPPPPPPPRPAPKPKASNPKPVAKSSKTKVAKPIAPKRKAAPAQPGRKSSIKAKLVPQSKRTRPAARTRPTVKKRTKFAPHRPSGKARR